MIIGTSITFKLLVMRTDVIFLIDSDFFDKNLLGMMLEKKTQCKVFCFFSFEETLLYKQLNPKLIIHDNSVIDHSRYAGSVSFFDISPNRVDAFNKDKTEMVLNVSSQVQSIIARQI